MEKLSFEFPAASPAAQRCFVGVVGSGDLEILLEPHSAGQTHIHITTSVDGMQPVWAALLSRIFCDPLRPAVTLEINDFGATPGVVRLRIEQALGQAQAQALGQGQPLAPVRSAAC